LNRPRRGSGKSRDPLISEFYRQRKRFLGVRTIALLRMMALCLLKQTPLKESIARKRKVAALNPDFLAETLAEAHKLEEI
jgi:hypothetical protein